MIYRVKFRFVFVVLNVEREMGLEPTTAALEGRCSTAELLPLVDNRCTVYQLPRIQSIIFHWSRYSQDSQNDIRM